MKNQLKSKKLQSAVAVSGTTAYTTAAVDVEFLDNIAFQVNGTSTATGAAQVQVSVDYSQDSQGNVLVAGNWVNLGSSTSIDFGATGSYYIAVNQLAAPYIRLVYTNATNSGTLTSYVCGKSLSA